MSPTAGALDGAAGVSVALGSSVLAFFAVVFAPALFVRFLGAACWTGSAGALRFLSSIGMLCRRVCDCDEEKGVHERHCCEKRGKVICARNMKQRRVQSIFKGEVVRSSKTGAGGFVTGRDLKGIWMAAKVEATG